MTILTCLSIFGYIHDASPPRLQKLTGGVRFLPNRFTGFGFYSNIAHAAWMMFFRLLLLVTQSHFFRSLGRGCVIIREILSKTGSRMVSVCAAWLSTVEFKTSSPQELSVSSSGGFDVGSLNKQSEARWVHPILYIKSEVIGPIYRVLSQIFGTPIASILQLLPITMAWALPLGYYANYYTPFGPSTAGPSNYVILWPLSGRHCQRMILKRKIYR